MCMHVGAARCVLLWRGGCARRNTGDWLSLDETLPACCAHPPAHTGRYGIVQGTEVRRRCTSSR